MTQAHPSLAPAVFGVLVVVAALHVPAAEAGDEKYYPKRKWGDFSGGDLNTSSFVFRDINRNGTYDLGDRPMPHVAVVLTKPDGKTLMRRTNTSGFANFKMSVENRDYEVVNPGHYAFRVAAPPGWSVTTENAVQESDYLVAPGAPGDMIALKTTRPVGLAAELTIGGTVPRGSTVTLTGPDGTKTHVAVGDDRHFAAPASPGEWQIDVTGEGLEAPAKRRVTIGSSPVLLSEVKHDAAAEPLPNVHVADFDTLMRANYVLEIPSGYGGLNWYNVVAMHQRFASGPGYINGTMSGEYIAYNSSGHPAAVFSDEPFDFSGASFAVGWNDAEGETLIIRAWRGEALAHEDRIALSSMSPVHFSADYRRITRLEIRTEHFWQIAMDDFAYRTAR